MSVKGNSALAASERPAESRVDDALGPGADLRFRALVGEEAWARLPDSVCRRFSKHIEPGAAVIYRGEVVLTEMSRAGRILAHLAKVVGGPLPLDNHATGESVVSVTEEAGALGQTWTRSYARSGQGPQIIGSMKCFRGSTGLEEHVGAGIGMALSVSVEGGALHFRSDHYFLELVGWRLRLPRFMEPGSMEIVHEDRPDLDERGERCAGQGNRGAFSFRLTLTHPFLGCLLHQLGHFRDS